MTGSCHVDGARTTISGATQAELLQNGMPGPTPLGMVCGPLGKAGQPLATEALEEVGEQAARRVAGLTPELAEAALDGMRNEGGHAMRHLVEQGIIPNKGVFASRLEQFKQIVNPILQSPEHVFQWKVGNSPSTAYASKVGEDWIVVFVADSGKWAGKVISTVTAEAADILKWGLK